MNDLDALRPPDRDDLARLSSARYLAIREQPYLATALLAMTPVMAPGLSTFAVDSRWRLYIDPDRLRQWTVGGVAAALLHEVNHLVRDHETRLRRLNPEPEAHHRRLWNIAADCAINDDLNPPGSATTPQSIALPMGVFPSHFGLASGQLEEQYYSQIGERFSVEELKHKSPLCDGGSAVDGQVDPRAGAADERGIGGIARSPSSIIRRQVRHEIEEAAARRPGTVPAGLLLWASEDRRPVIDWRQQLRAAVRRGIRTVGGWEEPTWRRPSRRPERGRFIPPGHQRRVPSVSVIIDTSASMVDDLGVALAEVTGVLSANRVGEVRILSCDVRATDPMQVRLPSKIQLVGGGGTDLRAGFDAALSGRQRPDLIVVITDGYTLWPSTDLRCAVLVVLVGDGPEPDRFRTVRVPDSLTTTRAV